MSHSCKGSCLSERFLKWLDTDNITVGQEKVKKCSECRIRFKEFDGWNCPCCGNGIRTRNTYCREKAEMKKKLNTAEMNTKTVTVNGLEILMVVRA